MPPPKHIRPDLWARLHRDVKFLPPPGAVGTFEEEEVALAKREGRNTIPVWRQPEGDAWLCLVGEDGRPLWRVRACVRARVCPWGVVDGVEGWVGRCIRHHVLLLTQLLTCMMTP
jgi:hypothetical protein